MSILIIPAFSIVNVHEFYIYVANDVDTYHVILIHHYQYLQHQHPHYSALYVDSLITVACSQECQTALQATPMHEPMD